ncbi:MAG: YihY/virulence factor BrkB family protein [Actinomycetaceae bacterium]|nr:YihY/virulence factor BrkB family protein [Actinomycetaceae bacterium]
MTTHQSSSTTPSEDSAAGQSAPSQELDSSSTVARAKAALAWLMNTRVMRAAKHYNVVRGNLLAGGIAYTGIFSLAAALTIGMTIAMVTVSGRPELFRTVIDSINTALPGILATRDNPGLLDPSSLVIHSVFTLASVISFFVLLWSALSLMKAIASSIEAITQPGDSAGTFAATTLRALAGFAVLALGVVASSAISTVSSSVGAVILRSLGLTGGFLRAVLATGAFLVSWGVNTLIVAFLIRFMAGVRMPRRDLWWGAGTAGLLSALLQIVGTSVIGSVASNKLLAPFAAIATLLVWLYLGARILLFSVLLAAVGSSQKFSRS